MSITKVGFMIWTKDAAYAATDHSGILAILRDGRVLSKASDMEGDHGRHD